MVVKFEAWLKLAFSDLFGVVCEMPGAKKKCNGKQHFGDRFGGHPGCKISQQDWAPQISLYQCQLALGI